MALLLPPPARRQTWRTPLDLPGQGQCRAPHFVEGPAPIDVVECEVAQVADSPRQGRDQLGRCADACRASQFAQVTQIERLYFSGAGNAVALSNGLVANSTLLLGLKHCDDGITLAAMTRCPCDGVTPGGGVARVACKEVGQARVIERVIGREPSDPREATNIDRKTTARGCLPLASGRGRGGQTSVGLHLSVLLQSVARSVKKTGCECYDR